MLGSPNRVVGAITGIVFLGLGVAGFFASSEFPPFDTTGGLLFATFGVNLALNVLRVLLGAALVLAAVSAARPARLVNCAVGTVALVLGFAGLFIVGNEQNIFALNVADNLLHFGAAALLLATGLGAERRPVG